MPSPLDKYKPLAYGIAGVAGASLVAWRTMFPWIGYDLHFINRMKHYKKVPEQMEKGIFLIDVFEGHVKANPNKTFIIYEGEHFTYKYVDEQANKVANLARQLGLGVTDVVTLLIHNEPEYVWTYYGLQKLGIPASFINHHLRGEALTHCIRATNSRVLIIGKDAEFLQAVQEVEHNLTDINKYVMGNSSALPEGYLPFDQLLAAVPSTPIEKNARAGLDPFGHNSYIFTSGTTGAPKPSIQTHYATFSRCQLLGSMRATPDDVLYTALPLYHTSGMQLALNCVAVIGCTMVLKKKFSAHEFWDDCRQYGVTCIQYIGEMCRYLLAQPKRDTDRKNSIRFMYGNGLRKDIWTEFLTRFNIPEILEFYGSSEGPAGFVNVFNKPGCVGRLSPFLRLFAPTTVELVKYDLETSQPVRGKDGYCIKVKQGEVGLMISSFRSDLPITIYTGKEATEKKMIRNAFKKGDQYFNFGDLLYMDKDYFMYFKDRIGDTFRWKGENVATIDVSNVLSTIDFIEDASVYGVDVPGADGKAGMACVKLKDDVGMTSERRHEIYKQCASRLPAYARPLFIRHQDRLQITATFKHSKVDLVKEGFNPDGIDDRLYFLDSSLKTYLPLDAKSYRKIVDVKARL